MATVPRMLLVFGVLAAGDAWAAADPRNVQDPPGGVSVDQPGGVSVADRDTERDVTDTLRGGATEVVEGKRAGRRAGGVIVRPSAARPGVQDGRQPRTSIGGTGSSAAPDQPETGADADPGTPESPESTYLGTDIGYGTGTEPAPSSSDR